MLYIPAYPTPQHALAAQAVTGFFSSTPSVDAVLLMGSTARGRVTPDSCLDILVLSRPEVLAVERPRLEQAWQVAYTTEPVYLDLLKVGAFSHIDLEFIDGQFDPQRFYHGWTSGADSFELEVGNILAYSVALYENGAYYRDLQARWLPYYGDDLRRERLGMVLKYCRNNLAHIPLFVPRKLYFQAFNRLYHAFEEFLQALFISHRTYPIAYDKWVREEVAEILGLPDLYEQLTHILEVQPFESQVMVSKARQLGELLDGYLLKE